MSLTLNQPSPSLAASSSTPPVVVSSTKSSGVTRVLAEAYLEHVEEAQSRIEAFIQPLFAPGEECLAYYPAEQHIPVIGWIPFVRVLDVMTRKKLLLVISDRRLLILQTNWAQSALKCVISSTPLSGVARIQPHTGVLTSSVRITLSNGQSFGYSEMLKSHAGDFAGTFQVVLAASNASGIAMPDALPFPSAPVPTTSGAGRLVLRMFLGALGFLMAFGGLSSIGDGKWGPAIFGICGATACFYATLVRLKPRPVSGATASSTP